MRKNSSLFLKATGAAAIALGSWGIYEGFIEPQKEWQNVPPPSQTIETERDIFSRRIVGVIEGEEEDGYQQKLELVGNGFTVVTHGREFIIKSVSTNGYKISQEDVLPHLDPVGVRAIATTEHTVSFYGPRGMITLQRADVMRIMTYLKNFHAESIPPNDIAYTLNAEVLFCDIERKGTCKITFAEQMPPMEGTIAMRD